MSDDQKATLADIPLPEIDFSKEVIDSEEGGAADKALVPFDPVQRYLAKFAGSPCLAARKSIGSRSTISSTETSKRLTSWLRRIFVWL